MLVARPSPSRVRFRPGSRMKFLPTVALMEATSPTCSIMVARAMGTMVSTALMNSGLPSMANRPMDLGFRGMPNQSACITPEKSTAPVTSATT